jgi:hypothetical protein
MARKHHKPEEIVAKLRQADVQISQGQVSFRPGILRRVDPPRQMAFPHSSLRHEPHHRRLADNPDELRDHRPTHCELCGGSVSPDADMELYDKIEIRYQ